MTTKKLKIESITLVMEEDTNGDASTLGEWTDDLDDWNIVRATGQCVKEMTDQGTIGPVCVTEFPPRGSFFRCFKPYAGGEKPGTKEYKKYGLQDWKRMEALNKCEWNYIGIHAEAVVSYPCRTSDARRMETLRSSGLWGIESDAGKTYFLSVVKEELADLRSHLAAFGVVLLDFDGLAKTAKEKCTWL